MLTVPPRELVPDVLGRWWNPGSLGRDEAIAALANRQEALVGDRQLRALGVDSRATRRRVRSARLFEVGPGVFSVGRVGLTESGRLIAAALAYGPGARIGFRAAAEWWSLLPGRRGRIDVVASTHREQRGTRLHRVVLRPGECAARRGVPVTSVGRTLADLATAVLPGPLESAVHEAQVLRLLSTREIAIATGASHRRRGGALLRRLLAEVDPEVVFRSLLELRFLAQAKREGIEPPLMNALVELSGRLVRFDAAWAEHHLAVELDSGFHDTPTAARRDAARDAAAAAAGWSVLRLRSDDLRHPLLDLLPDPVGRRPDPG